MNILNGVAREAFELPPLFNSAERKRYFDLPVALEQFATGLRTATNQLCFLLSCGYFKATYRFYRAQAFRPRDLSYVADRLAVTLAAVNLADYDKQTRARHQAVILDFYGFRPFKPHGQALLVEELARLVQSQFKPQLLFARCLEVLVREKVEVPGYFRLAALILRAINGHDRTLVARVEQTLCAETRALLDALLIQETADEATAPGTTSAYKLTLLKKLSQSTKPSKVKERVADLALVEELYQALQPVLAALALNQDAIQYFAHSVIKAKVFQLTRREEKDRYLHLVAFIAHQYYRLQDNLVDVLLSSLQSFHNSALREHKEQCYARREQRYESLKMLVAYLDSGVERTLSSIATLTEDSALSDSEKVNRIRAVLATRAANRQREQDQLAAVQETLVQELGEDDYYAILAGKSLRLQQRVSPILKALTFLTEPSAAQLQIALDHFRSKDGVIDKTAPVEFLSPDERKAVTHDGKLRVSLYKALLFTHVQGAIKSGTLNLAHSYKYRPFDEYLIDRARWQRDKEALIERAQLEALVDPRQVLADLDEALYHQYVVTNTNIHDGKNPHITFKKTGFSLSTPKQEESEAESLQQFFPERDYVPLLEVLATVNRYSRWLDELQHWQQRFHHGRPAEQTVYAGVIALGCTIGLRKMARISHPISEAALEHTVNWYFSLDNLIAANDRVLQLMDRLELPNLMRRSPDRLHTSSDGQKFEVRRDSLNANYSYKYFGKGQGVSAYTFRDERDLLWYSLVFSSAERESAYVIDGLMHNDVVKSDIHSTDAFGYSEAIFATSHLLGFSYAPRFKNLKRHRLYIFHSRRQADRSTWKVQPTGYVDTERIIQYWDDILRFSATIKLKETTASDLFRRLNSYSKQHGLYQALKAFGQILKSHFILRVIDDPVLRQAIERVLNGVEHVHRFTRAVSVGNPREFLQAEKQEQELAEACKRLIKNCIICWNYLYLSQKLADLPDPASREALLAALTHGSAVAWQHLNLLGEYDFSEERLQDTVGIKLPKFTD
ncbi:MAG: Tn3 family transposase [Pyrinomonadaceae bacterium]|nr:Tn3 family transposase [Pyrinomonadaceae bacterium]